MAFCKNCGKEVKDGAAFCSSCGQALTSTNSAQNNTTASSAQNVVKPAIRKPLLYVCLVIAALIIGLYVILVVNGDIVFLGTKPLKHISKCSNPIDEPLEFDDTYFDVTGLKVKMKGDTLVFSGKVHNKMNNRAFLSVCIGVYDEDGERKDLLRGRVGEVAGKGSSEFRFEVQPNCVDEIVYYNLEGVTA